MCVKTNAQKVWGNPTVVVRADTPRLYIVQSPDGSTFTRNRCHHHEIPVPVTEHQFVPDVMSNGSPAPHTPKVVHRPKVISEPIREVLRLLVRLNQLFQPQLPGLVE